MATWRLIVDEKSPGGWNMAVDEALLESARIKKSPLLRLYQWETPTLSLGYFQKADLEVNVENCSQLGIDWVRRPTGGRAVLHHQEVTYSVVIPLDYPGLPGGVTASYLWISRGLLQGLSYLGIEASLAPGAKQTGQETAACFDSPSYYELVAEGKKLCGSAQMRRGGVLLQHGSLLLDLDLDLYVAALKFADERQKHLTRHILAKKSTNLKEISNRSFTACEVNEALIQGFVTALGINFAESELSESENQLAHKLVDSKYSTADWNQQKKAAPL